MFLILGVVLLAAGAGLILRRSALPAHQQPKARAAATVLEGCGAALVVAYFFF